MAEKPHAMPIGQPLALAAPVQYDSTPPHQRQGSHQAGYWVGHPAVRTRADVAHRGTGAADAW